MTRAAGRCPAGELRLLQRHWLAEASRCCWCRLLRHLLRAAVSRCWSWPAAWPRIAGVWRCSWAPGRSQGGGRLRTGGVAGPASAVPLPAIPLQLAQARATATTVDREQELESNPPRPSIWRPSSGAAPRCGAGGIAGAVAVASGAAAREAPDQACRCPWPRWSRRPSPQPGGW